jgi:hypothetical protein
MKKTLIPALALVFAAGPALAQGTIEGAQAFGWLQPYVNTAVSAVLLFGIGWGAMILKTKFNLDIDAQQRDALHMFLARQAASLVADGFVKVDGLKITVPSAALAQAANAAGSAIPSALAHFNITPVTLQAMIVDKLPAVPSVAAVSAAQLAPPPAPAVVVEAAAGSTVKS